MSSTRGIGNREEADLVILVDANGVSAAGPSSSQFPASLGQKTVANSTSVTLASDDTSGVAIGTTTDAAVAAGAAGTLSAKLRAISRDIVANIVLAAGSAIIGKVGIDQTTPGTTDRVTVGAMVDLTVTPTLSVAGAYVTGDYIGQTTTPESFALAVRTTAGSGIVTSLTITDKVTTAAVALELWLFSATFTAPTDNAAWAITDAEALLCVGVIPITTDRWFANSNSKIYSDNNLGLVIKCAATSLFFALVARGTTPTWAAGDLQLTLGIVQQ